MSTARSCSVPRSAARSSPSSARACVAASATRATTRCCGARSRRSTCRSWPRSSSRTRRSTRPATGASLDDALAYLRDERDLRGIEPRVGWIHATAHTADLLKFLARDARFAPADHVRLLDAAWSKLTAPGTPVFTHAEDERLAAALVSVARRADFDPASLDPWLARFAALEKQVWEKSPPEPAALDASQNARNLLRSFYVLLSLPQPVADRGPDGRARQGARDAAADPALSSTGRAPSRAPFVSRDRA